MKTFWIAETSYERSWQVTAGVDLKNWTFGPYVNFNINNAGLQVGPVWVDFQWGMR